jgi:chromosome partitioning protein
MAKVITFGIQKGGSAKTTSAGIIGYLLSLRYKVLACDMDSQGNLTELLMQRNIYDFHGRTILEAMKQKDARPYIHPVTDTLDMLTAEDLLATFPRYLYQEYRGGNPAYVLRDTLRPVMSQYDFIVIDTPPALGDQTINALAASDGVVILYETSKFAYSALERFVETVVHVQEKLNPKLEVYGILPCMIDSRRTDTKALLDLAREEYGDLVFQTIIKRRAATGRLPIHGFTNNPEVVEACEQYVEFLDKELMPRVRQKENA